MLEFDNISHAYAGTAVLAGVSLLVEPGRVVALTGPSGCGKTTLLHLAAGLLSPSAGRIENRFQRPAYVFQDPRLLPWRTAAQNMAFGLKARGAARDHQQRTVGDLLARLDLNGSARKFPHQLSGGMRQRVAIGRALAIEPDVLFMDEPFSALDVGLRRELQDLLLDLLRERNLAVLFVTHDLAESVRIGDEVVVLSSSPGSVAFRRARGARGHPLDGSEVHRRVADLLDVPAVAMAFGLGSGAITMRDLQTSPTNGRLKPVVQR